MIDELKEYVSTHKLEEKTMTKEEAIEVLKDLWRYEKSNYSEKQIRKALDMAIEALEILEFAEKNLQFAVEHTRGETKDHYQRALNLLIKENKQ